MMIDDILFRQGHRIDCLRIAELDNLASGGAIDYLFHDLIPGLSPVEIVAANLKKDDFPYTFNSAIVAEHQKSIIGMSLSFPAGYHHISDEMRDFFPEDRLQHFEDFFTSRVEGSYYLDALGVDPAYRNAGVGGELMHQTRERAIEEGFTSLSLIVFADNVDAIRFYKRFGFKTVKHIELEFHERVPHQGGCLLMALHLA